MIFIVTTENGVFIVFCSLLKYLLYLWDITAIFFKNVLISIKRSFLSLR